MMMSRKLTTLFVFLLPSLLPGEATMRYKTEITGPIGSAGLSDLSYVVYMKGSRGAMVSSGETVLVDFGKNQITLVDSEGRKYATIPAADYGAKLAEGVPQMGDASGILKSMTSKCDSRSTGGTAVIQAVRAMEREVTCTLEVPVPDSLKNQAGGGMQGLGMKLVLHVWSASPEERPRVPALWQLSGFDVWRTYFMNPAGMLDKLMPGGLKNIVDELSKDQSMVLRCTMEITMSMQMHFPASDATGSATNSPLMKMSQEVVELSTGPLDDSLFAVPDGYTAAPFAEVMNGITQARIQAIRKPAAQSPVTVPANIQAYVPGLTPLSRTEPVRPEGAQGMVEVLITVSPKGTVQDAEALSGPDSLRSAAVAAVKQWTFRPVLRNGAPVAAYTDTTIDLIDWSKGAGAAIHDLPDMTSGLARKTQLEEALPRSPRQVFDDLSQDAGGTDRQRRFYLLSPMASAAIKAGAWDEAASVANELLVSSKEFTKDWNYGNAVYTGHAVLGLVALHGNDITAASAQLLEAGKTPGSPQLNSFGPNVTLASALLEKGQRDVVLQYFELCRKFWKMGGERLDSWIATVGKGETPVFGPNLSY